MINKSEHFTSPDGNATALITPKFHLNYEELAEQSLAVKDNLMQRGLSSGQRIGLLGPNSPEYVKLVYGLWQAGMVPVPLNTRWPVNMIRDSLHGIECSFLIELSNQERRTDLQGITIINGSEILRIQGIPGEQNTTIQFELDHDATILFTSGSSNKPKAALHSFRNHFFSARGSAQNISFKAGDCWLLSLPFYHIGGMAILFRALLGGGAVFVPSPLQTLKKILSEHQITHISLVAAQFKQLLEDQSNLPYLKDMKAILLGGGPIPKNLVEIAAQKKLSLFCSYGSTEMSSQITTTKQGDIIPQIQTAGSVLPYRELMIAENSEILVRGDTLFRGYILGDIIDSARDSNGWFHTGDLGEMDKQGYLTLTGRRDNMFISGGENIQPEEIETAIMQIEGISEVMVVPVDHPDYGKRPVAYIKILETKGQEGKIQENKIQDTRVQDDKIQQNTKKKASPAGGREKSQKLKFSEVWVEELRQSLENQFPKFMIPDHFFPWPEEGFSNEAMKTDRQLFRKLANQHYSKL